ncbi:type VI secretion system Vgr family protein [Hyalangium gracile]|uniref:type VI secretion system Vgr family protein n=1 Tax=Hyalangium gracile TaxID=394092 RepID=UPI001CCDAF0B|nr:type VI secretion system tip protein TssI/VgrG [Hyalangium gracile]
MPELLIENNVTFLSSALGPEELVLLSLKGREAISELYSFELWLAGEGEVALASDTIEDVMAGTVGVAFGLGFEFPIWGVLKEIELVARDDSRAPLYRAVMVPRLWYTTQTRRSRVYQGSTVREIVTAVLKDAGMKEGEHFDFKLEGTYPKREYVLQYQETDFDFCCRLLEHEGISFFFEQTVKGEKILFVDANGKFGKLEGHESIAYLQRDGATDPGESIWSMSCNHRMVPRQVTLRDYNYRTPTVPLLAHQPVQEKGRGHQVLYGEHFKDAGEGKRLAKVRSEEFNARRNVYVGKSRVRALRSGHLFTLTGHPLGQFDQRYLVTEVLHQVDQTPVSEFTEGARGTQGYTNSWVGIPADVPFRPERRTPRPLVSGVLNGVVDGPVNGAAAPLDEQGRYHVLMPIDTVGRAGGRASRAVRMLQASSGANYGMHLPLHVGTEVAIGHVNGDPDRPVIIGSVPNPETMTPVVEDNATQSVIRTRAGIHVEFEDDA